jgi:hypothetical protein
MATQQKEDESIIPTAASGWKKETLDLLNAKYDSESVTPFNFGELFSVPSELQKRLTLPLSMLNRVIDQVAEELTKVNDSNEIIAGYDFDSRRHPLLALFSKFYDGLDQTIRKESPDPPKPQTDTPPVQITYPPNPNPGYHSPASSSLRESTEEHFTHFTANDFLWATMDTISVKHYKWGPEKTKLSHSPFSTSRVSLTISKEQKMKIKLGQSKTCKRVARVEARSDGGVKIYPNNSKCFYPVFSVEVSLSLSLKCAKRRLNERNTVCVSRRVFINGTLPRFMPKCWVKSVIRTFMNPTSTVFKRLTRTASFAHLRHLYFMRDMQRSIYFTPNFRTIICEISLFMARNT